MPETPPERVEVDDLATERANPESADLDLLTSVDALEVFDREDRRMLAAVAACRAEIAAAIELVVARLVKGGRLLYVGSGTSGRLGVLDAVECPPTFQSDPESVQGRIAGGRDALVRSIEGAEDSATEGAREVADATADDVVFGIAASGRTPFVHGALEQAARVGAGTILLACVPRGAEPDRCDVAIRVLTGPEVLAGSTRLKAGTATKLVLNRVTTIAMARLGKTYGNRMVDVNTRGNAKLAARGVALVRDLCSLGEDDARALLERADGRVKVAVAMQHLACSASAARARLAAAGGFLRAVLEQG